MGFMDFFISVKLKDKRVYISGINAGALANNIAKVQGDRRFVTYVLSLEGRSISLPEFFLADFYAILEKVYYNTNHIPYKYTIQKIREEIIKNTWLGDTNTHYDRLNLNNLKNIYYKPKDYQLQFLNYYNEIIPKYKLKGALLAAIMGAGKSAMGLMIAECLQADRVIIICPLPAVSRVWEQQINEVIKKKQTYWLSTDKANFNGQRFAIYHYEALQKALDDLNTHRSAKKNLVILDESHNFNNLKSLRTQLFIEFVQKLQTNDIIFSTGTPIKALGNEAVVLFKAIDPLFTDDVQTRFTKLFGEKSSQANIDLLKTRLGQVSFKVTRAQVNLGKPNFITLPVTIDNSDRYLLTTVANKIKEFIEDRTSYYISREKEDIAYYNFIIDYYEKMIRNDFLALEELHTYKQYIKTIQKAAKENTLYSYTDEMVFCNKVETKSIMPRIPTEDAKKFKEIKTLVKYPKLKIQGEALGRILGKLRIECHRDMVSGIDLQSIIDESLKKTIIFSSYIEVCQEVSSRLKKLDYTPSEVYGSSTKNLTSIVNDFMTKEDYNPLIATYASLSTAVPLIAANTMILINSPFRAYIQEQAIARIFRLGATTPVFIYECYLDTKGQPNLSTRGIDILQWSRDMVESITGVKPIYDDMNIKETNDGLTIANEAYDISIIEKFDIEFQKTSYKNILSDW